MEDEMVSQFPPMDPRHPPKNRRATELPILRIEIEHADGTDVRDPNGVIMDLLTDPGRIPGLRPLADRKSDLSGGPAVLYRSDDLELALTPAEMTRFLSRELQPDEFIAIRDRYGICFEIHDDFYDVETGEALQPLSDR